jgi:hypothetical protein
MTNNFDFLVGTWTSTQRRLREVLNGCDEWYEFEGVSRGWKLLDGACNIDEVAFPSQGFSGVTVRLQNKETGDWSLYWVDSRMGEMGMPPQVGRFDETGRGEFLADDVYNGRPVKVAYIWSDITEDTAHWEQAFSVDSGDTWETNWTAEFRRVTD